MSEQFSILIDSRTRFETSEPGGVWLSMPTTKEQLHEAMQRVGITADNPQDFFINGFANTEQQPFDVPLPVIQSAGLDELNYLGNLLAMQRDEDRDKFTAAVALGERAGSVKDLINLAQNLDCYWLYPTVQNEEDYGYYLIDELDELELPEEAKKYFMYEDYGRDAAINDGGRFTEQGYIYNNKNTFTEWYNGRESDIPREYRVMSFPQPHRPDPSKVEMDAAAPGQKTVQTIEQPQEPRPVIPIVLTSEKPAEKLKEITDRLEQGITELFDSERYREYLRVMSKFHNYSFNNTMLIAMQKPDATLVAGFKAWQKNFDRHVKKGEKGIRILAPAPYKIKEEQEKLDPVTGEIMLDKNGMPITEEVEIKIPAFRVVPVFDVSQTDGKELPDIGVSELSGSVEDYEDFMQALTEVSPVPITYEDIEGEVKGYFHTTYHRIAIQEGMSQSQTVKTAIHEVAHAKLHDRERNQDIDAVLDKDRNTQEVEAESVAYTVCQHFGIDTSDYSFGYIAGWSSDRDMKELKSALDTIRKTASELITGIEDRLAELQKDRAVEQEQNKESILLIQNDDLTKYSLVSVMGMDRQELMDVLSAMSEDDKLSIQAYLESKGAWTTEIANENTKEFGEYHLDVRYNTDTEELVDMKERKAIYDKSMEPIAAGDVVVKFSGSMGSEWEISKITNMSPDEVKKLLYDMALLNESEWDGDYNAYLKEHGAEMTLISSSAGLNEHAPQFFDFAYDADTGVSASTELSAIQQAENLINRMEHGATVFTDDERNLIVNYNYKLDDMEKTRELAENLAYMIENQPVNEALTVIDAQAEIDALPDGMIGLSEMHEYGYSWNEMLPLTKDKATELFGEDVAVYQLHEDGSETLIEDSEELKEHEGIFGVEKDDWSAYLEHKSMKQELEESPANREAQLLFGSEDRFGIYQLKDTEEAGRIQAACKD